MLEIHTTGSTLPYSPALRAGQLPLPLSCPKGQSLFPSSGFPKAFKIGVVIFALRNRLKKCAVICPRAHSR